MRIEVEPGVRLFVDIEGAGLVLGQSFGGFVAQRLIARHAARPGKVILSSTTHHLGLARKLAMFEQLGGHEAGAVAEAFWTQPDAQTWTEYNRVCTRHYNTTPQDDEAGERTVFNTDRADCVC